MLSQLSVKSLGKIFDALEFRPLSLRNLQQTCWDMKEVSEELDKQWRFNVHDVRLYYRHKDWKVSKDQLCLYIYPTIEESIPAQAQRADHTDYHDNHPVKVFYNKDKYFVGGSGLRKLESSEDLMACAKRLLTKALKNIRSVRSLTLMNVDIEPEIYQLFDSMRISELTLYGFSKKLDGKELLALLKRFSINSLTLIGDLSNISLNNMHLLRCTDKIKLHECSMVYPRKSIDRSEQVLTNWLYNTPTSIDFQCGEHNLPLASILNFVQDLAVRINRRKDKTPRSLYFGAVGYYDEMDKQLVQAQRSKLFHWNVQNYWIGCQFHKITIVGFPVKIIFYLFKKRLCNITKAQAEKRIAVLQEYIRNQLNDNPRYNRYDDVYLVEEVTALRGQIYEHWDDLVASFERRYIPPFMLNVEDENGHLI